MELILRHKAYCIIKDYKSNFWVTKRKKIRRNCRRQLLTNKSVRYFPLHNIPFEDYILALYFFNCMKRFKFELDLNYNLKLLELNKKM